MSDNEKMENQRKDEKFEKAGENCAQTSRDINKKREDYLCWTDYFMATAFLAAKRSKDPRTQVGACIVNEDNRIVGVGYNDMPRGCSGDQFSWDRGGDIILETKQLYVCHAEMNAILNKNSADVKNCTIYVGLFPCNECAKLIIQSGIREVIYTSKKKKDKRKIYAAAERMFKSARIKLTQYIPQRPKILIDFTEIK